MRLPLIGLLLTCVTSPAMADDSISTQIDQIIEAACKRQNTPIAEMADDSEFLRRVYLDLNGVVPTASEAAAFLTDSNQDKRSKLIDELLQRPEFALHMARVFDAMLIERRIATIPSYDIKAPAWRNWLIDSFRQNKPWDQFVGQILGSDGTDEANGAAAKFYLVRDVEPHLVARDIGRLFLGADRQCAQCHDDPRIKAYRQNDYYGVYAFVSRLKHFHDGQAKRNFVEEKFNGDVEFSSAFTGTAGKTNPRLPGGEMIADPPLVKDKEYSVKPESGKMGIPAYSRRSQLARFLPRRETAGFSTNIANRVWAMMFGRGIVHPLDMHHPDNPPSHPALLKLLSERLEQSNFDMKLLIRDIALSQTYQRSSRLPTERIPQPSQFAVAALRPLSPEQLGWSVTQVGGRLPALIAKIERRLQGPTKKPSKGDAEPAETAYAQTIISEGTAWQARRKIYGDLHSEMKPLFQVFSRLPGQPDNGFQPTVDQAMFLLNSDQMVKIFDQASISDRLSKTEKSDEVAAELYLSAFSRFPSEEERGNVTSMLKDVKDHKQRREIVRRILWGLLISAEFRLNH